MKLEKPIIDEPFTTVTFSKLGATSCAIAGAASSSRPHTSTVTVMYGDWQVITLSNFRVTANGITVINKTHEISSAGTGNTSVQKIAFTYRGSGW